MKLDLGQLGEVKVNADEPAGSNMTYFFRSLTNVGTCKTPLISLFDFSGWISFDAIEFRIFFSKTHAFDET